MNVAALVFSLLSILASVSTSTSPSSYDALRADAEKAFAEGSYAIAHDLYAKVDRAQLTAADAKWVRFRLADSDWRALQPAPQRDSTRLDADRAELQALINEAGSEHDRVWAEAQESLGDMSSLFSARDPSEYYRNALGWWGASEQLDLARQRYLTLVRNQIRPNPTRYWYRGANAISTDVLVNARTLATTADDRGLFAYTLAQLLVAESDPVSVERGGELFEEVLALGKSNAWYDDALFAYASDLENRGAYPVGDGGTISFREPDFDRALLLYRRLVSELKPSESQYVGPAEQGIRRITETSLVVRATNVFLPGSEVAVQVHSRNVEGVELQLSPVDLTRDLIWKDETEVGKNLSGATRAPIRRWTVTRDAAGHRTQDDAIRISGLAPGAYLLTARGNGASDRTLVLVTDVAVVTRTSKTKSVVFVCNALSGKPFAGATVVLTRHDRTGAEPPIVGVTNADGLFEAPNRGNGMKSTSAAVAVDLAHQALDLHITGREEDEEPPIWTIYAYADRPSYRPGETAHFKFTAREMRAEHYVNPAGRSLHWTIASDRGEKVAEGTAKLNLFGSAWDSVPLTETMGLGEYEITFTLDGKEIGGARLFRLEEYKLPESKVEVRTPEENGVPKLYRLGDTVEATVEATYYFGGPVAAAEVEVEVYQQAWFRPWWEGTPSARYFRNVYDGGSGAIIQRESLVTDASGRAVIRFPTPRDGSAMQYRIEARVTDASRREVVGTGSLRVLAQRYAVSATPRHWISHPGQKLEVDFKALDSNDRPVRTTGTVTVTRDWWDEVWIDPQGHDVRGAALEKLRAGTTIFPPKNPDDPCDWRLGSRGYVSEEVLETTLETDAAGVATLAFTPLRDGYYRLSWSSLEIGVTAKKPAVRDLVTAETAVWIASSRSIDLGYRHDGLEIVVDRAAFRRGEKAPAMIIAPDSGRWVLFSVDGNDIIETRVLHLDGTAKLVEIALDERHVPNVFLHASSVAGGSLSEDEKELVVPPVEQFLDVAVRSDRAEYDARQEATLTVTTRDVDGKPVPAEVALGVADESVYAIEGELAGDPRDLFFGTKRDHDVSGSSSFANGPYVRLDRPPELPHGEQVPALSSSPPSPPPSSPTASVQFAASEAITVTGMAPVVERTAMNMAMKSNKDDSRRDRPVVPAQEPAEPAVVVRNDFRSTAFWQPDLITGADGKATVTLTWPDALTTWRATARAVSQTNQFGIGTASATTRKELIVRLEGPRFFVVGDEVTLSAVINNNSDKPMHVRPTLDVEGLAARGALVDGKAALTAPELDVPANGEARADWRVAAEKGGSAKLRVTARSDGQADAMEKSFPVYEHGVDKLLARSGKLRGAEAVVTLDLPPRRGTVMTVQVTPTLAVTMLDALPYLIDYPYGCTEQTMSRFLPAAIVARTLAKLGLDAGDVAGHLFGGIEPSSAAATHPKGKPALSELDPITAASMARLYDFQHADGGWGWWKQGSSDPWMTAYVVWGFSVARSGGLAVRADAVDRAAHYLTGHLVGTEFDLETQTWMLHALTSWRRSAAGRDAAVTKAVDNVWSLRTRLSSYGRALFAVVLENEGRHEQALVLIRNLENGVKRDAAPDNSVLLRGADGHTATAAETMASAHWGEDGFWWRWSQSPVETTSFVLRALMRVDPKNALVEPAMNWLVKNRRGAQWNNTRDTAIAVLALNDYLDASGELGGDVTYEVTANGKPIATQTVAPGDVLRAPSRFTVDPALVRDGANELRIRRTHGSAPLYFAAEARFVSLEEPVKAAGNELFVRRDYYRMAPHPTLLAGVVYDREPLLDGGFVKSGERIEVILTVETKNDDEYLLFEDLKPAGLEAIELQSGDDLVATELKTSVVDKRFVAAKGAVVRQSARTAAAIQTPPGSDTTGRVQQVYRELRDRKVALFIDRLPQGVWEIRYTLRAEVPGRFHALPLLGQAMYVPEIRANGDELRLEVKE